MSNHSSRDDEDIARATTVHAHKGGVGGKLVLGALAAVVLGGAGYLAYNNYTQAPANTQTAYNDPYAAGIQHAGPLPPVQSAAPENPASPDETSTPAPVQTAAATPARHTAPRNAVHEETIGIVPASVTASETSADENVIVNAPPRPTWTRVPSARRLAALYPVVAQEQGREGEAKLHCTVLESGALNCARVSETRGFGNAALRVARTFRHAPQFADGSNAIGAPVNLRVVFRLPEETRRS